MKRFDSLEAEEKKRKNSESIEFTQKKRIIPWKPIILIIIAIAIIIILCIKLFGTNQTTLDSSASKTYEIEVDGKKYSADTIEELSEMAGFDVSYLFNNNNSKKKNTKVEAKLYENGELANIETEYGTYKFGVTNATLLKRPPAQGGEIMYQITYVIENKDFDSGDGSGVGLFPENLTITDSDGNKCDAFSQYYDAEMINAYDTTAPGKKTEKKAIYKVSNQNCEYLEIYFASRGVTCKIELDNVKEFRDEHKEQQIDIGTPVIISDTAGKMVLTVDSIRIDNSFKTEASSDEDLLIIDFDIDNTSYDTYGSNLGIDSCWTLSNIISVTDDQNYTVNLMNSFSGTADGKYSFYNGVKPGAKGRIALPYAIQKETQSVTIDFRNGTTLTVDL